MGAEILNITDFKPYLSDESIEKIADKIMTKIEALGDIPSQDEIPCANGFVVEFHVSNEGFNYKRAQLGYLAVHLFDKENERYTIAEDCELYADKLNSILSDRICDLNSTFEEEFENSKEFAEYGF